MFAEAVTQLHTEISIPIGWSPEYDEYESLFDLP
jgi:hypothetical protein